LGHIRVWERKAAGEKREKEKYDKEMREMGEQPS
jgi:hypothetical protein